MKRIFLLVALFCVPIANGCGASDPKTSVELPIQHIEDSYWPPDAPQGEYVVRDKTEWARVWGLHEPKTFPKTPKPKVDFSKYMVIGLSRGSGPNANSGLRILRVVRSGDKIRVEYAVARGGRGASFAIVMALTDFVRVPRTDGEVSFVEVGLPER